MFDRGFRPTGLDWDEYEEVSLLALGETNWPTCDDGVFATIKRVT